MTTLRYRTARLLAEPGWGRSMLTLAIIALVFGVIAFNDAAHTSNRPVEHTTVVSSTPTGHQISCGKYWGDEYRVQYRSANPPTGMPSEFSQKQCDPPETGSHDTAVRVPRPDGSVSVYIDPVHSYAEAAVTTLGVTAVFAAILIPLNLYRAKRRRRDGQHRKATA